MLSMEQNLFGTDESVLYCKNVNAKIFCKIKWMVSISSLRKREVQQKYYLFSNIYLYILYNFFI